jgi:hypothetical protein
LETEDFERGFCWLKGLFVELGEDCLGRRESVRKIECSPSFSTDPFNQLAVSFSLLIIVL